MTNNINNKQNDDDDNSDMEWSDEEGMVVDGIHIPKPAEPPVLGENQSRLIIQHINIKYFKSFAVEQVVGPFHKRFNAIIGPNGNGKSNVIDALLFVFGYRATKIRSKKLSVLLHNSEHFQNISSCKVSIHFCIINDKDGDDYEVVPGSEFVIARIANKDNSSYYELNDRKVQFKEIAQLLKTHGVDLIYNRFLILQGEVEEIAMMKCKGANENETGLLEYLEDVIGTTRYKKPLEQLQERIEILSEQSFEKMSRLKLSEKELDELKGPMQVAVDFLKNENQISVLKNLLYQKQIYMLEQKKKEIEEEKTETDEKHGNLTKELNQIIERKKEKQAELNNIQTEYEKFVDREEKLKSAINNAEKRDVELQHSMTKIKETYKKNTEKLAAERKKLVTLQQVPEKNAATISKLEVKEKELMSKLEELEEEKQEVLSKIRAETEELQAEKETLEKELAPLLENSNAKKAEFNMAEAELQLHLSNEEDEKNRLAKLKENYKNTVENLQTRTGEVEELQKKLPKLKKSLENARVKFESNRKEESEIVKNLNAKRVTLEEKKSSMQASRSKSRVLDALMQQKREGKCDGIYGRLGDLGAIDQKYDVAISTACGRLDNIVVDTVQTAEWCIKFLKTHDIGRATFIALEKQNHLKNAANAKYTAPARSHRLFDLIKLEDDRFKPAFYFALGDTLVADNIDIATPIAYGAKRYRVVTLNGNLIETSGTMSGGGTHVMRGKMGQKVVQTQIDPKLIETMSSELIQLENRLREIRSEQGSLEEEIMNSEPQLREMTINLEKYSADLKCLKQMEAQLKTEIKQQESVTKTTKADPAILKKLRTVVDQKKQAYEKSISLSEKLQQRVAKLTQTIKEKTTGRIKNIDEKLKNTRNEFDQVKSEITKLTVGIKTSTRTTKTCEDKINNLEKDIQNHEKQLEALKVERDEIENDNVGLMTCLEELQSKMKKGDEIFNELKEEVQAITKEENVLKSKKVDVDAILNAFNKKLNECNENIHKWHARLSQIKLHNIPNETVEPLKELTPEEMDVKTVQTIESELRAAENLIKDAKPNLQIISEYEACAKKYQKRFEDLEAVNTKLQEIKTVNTKVRDQRKNEFITGFNIIKTKLQEMYQMITLGGNADLEFADAFDPFSDGIIFNVRPPKKSWKQIANLSGGEKTLSSLALVFALHYYKPSPLYVMDEIDAALDFKNVSIVGNYIKEGTKNAQFIIISLRAEMFELADRLAGIYKTHNSTKVVVIDPRGYAEPRPEVVVSPPPIATQNDLIEPMDVQVEEE